MTAQDSRLEQPITGPACDFCEGFAATESYPCACERGHAMCDRCRRSWEVSDRIEVCPNSDEFRLAAEVMGR